MTFYDMKMIQNIHNVRLIRKTVKESKRKRKCKAINTTDKDEWDFIL